MTPIGKFNSSFKPTIIYDYLALQKAKYLVSKMDKEIQWFHRMDVSKDRSTYYIYDLIIPQQEVSLTETNSDSSMMLNLYRDLVKERGNKENEKEKKNEKVCEKDKDNNINTKDILTAVVKGMKDDDTDIMQKIVSKQEEDKLTLSYILNLIDGIRETTGRIMIITSNYYNKLDKALIRPGRIDITLKLNNASIETISNMYYYYYNEYIPKKYMLSLKNCVLSPADIVNVRLNSNSKTDFIQKIISKINVLNNDS